MFVTTFVTAEFNPERQQSVTLFSQNCARSPVQPSFMQLTPTAYNHEITFDIRAGREDKCNAYKIKRPDSSVGSDHDASSVWYVLCVCLPEHQGGTLRLLDCRLPGCLTHNEPKTHTGCKMDTV